MNVSDQNAGLSDRRSGRARAHALLRRFALSWVVVAVSAVFPVDAHSAAQAPASEVPPLSLIIDVDYDASPLTGNPPTQQNILSLCTSPLGSGSGAPGSQNLRPDAQGAFNEIWSVTTPVVRVTGTVTTSSFSAALNCLDGSAIGSISASGDMLGYTGTWTMSRSGNNYTGETVITRRCAEAGGPYEIESNDGINDPLQLNANACGLTVPGEYKWEIGGSECLACGDHPAPYLDSLETTLLGPTHEHSGVPYTVSLTFTDPHGRSTISRTTLTIWDNRPFAIYAAAPAIVECSEPVNFTADLSYHGSPNHQIIAYRWDLTDVSGPLFGEQITHRFDRPGVKYFSLLVTDDNDPAESDLVGTVRRCAPGCIEHYAYVIVRSDQQPFTDEVLETGSSVVNALHFTELRARIDGVRAQFGLAAYSYADGDIVPGRLVTATHITEMRTSLAEAYARAGTSPSPYTDPGLARGSSIKAAHVNDLRSAVLVLECAS
jgi:hypothetical protein